jgi:DhnA family fructose-bisphosphate aldolase class Ia
MLQNISPTVSYLGCTPTNTNDEALLDEIRAIKASGGIGSIIGRNSFQCQRPHALKLLSEIMDIYATT